MNHIKFIKKEGEKKILNILNKEFGITSLPGVLFQSGKERLFLFTGSFGKKEILQLSELTPIERIGVYVGKIINNEIRLTIEGTQIFKDQIKRNIFELNENQMKQWMTGEELLIKTGHHGYLVMKYKNEFLGCGKASEEKIGNYVQKARRLKRKD